MFNRFIATNSQFKFRIVSNSQRKSEVWARKYKTEIRPSLISKHERRIQGFAKKMQCQPIILPQCQPVINYIDQHHHEQPSTARHSMRQSSHPKFGNTQSCIRSARIKTERSIQTQQTEFIHLQEQKYVEPIQSFRKREKDKQINPPMKYGNKNSNLILEALSARRKNKKKKDIDESEDKDSDHNFSQFDRLSQLNSIVPSKPEQFKTEAQIKEEEELKALSRDRLYFKSLVNFEQKITDENVKKYVRDILIKCRAIKPKFTKKKKEEIDIDYFAQLMKQFSVKSKDS